MHFKAGALLLKMELVFFAKDPVAATHFRACLELLAKTPALEEALAIQPARVTRVWQDMTLFFLRGVGTEQDVAAAGSGPLPPAATLPGRADNADDFALYGTGHFFVWQNQNDPQLK